MSNLYADNNDNVGIASDDSILFLFRCVVYRKIFRIKMSILSDFLHNLICLSHQNIVENSLFVQVYILKLRFTCEIWK